MEIISTKWNNQVSDFDPEKGKLLLERRVRNPKKDHLNAIYQLAKTTKSSL